MPRWLSVTLSILVGVVLFAIGYLQSVMALVANTWAFEAGVVSVIGVLVVLFLLPLWGTVFVRRRWPWVPFSVGLGLALAWGDCLLMLIGMFHLIIRGTRRAAATAAIVGSGASVLAIVRMCLMPTALNPFSFLFITSGSTPGNVTTPAPPRDLGLAVDGVTIAVGLLALGISLGVGFLLRRTRRMRSVEAFASHEAQRNEALSAELARQSERELLARELHDTLSHRLSVISLHSGALEVGGKGDADVASTASALRQEAHASLEDLRHLVGGVREGTLTGTGPKKEQSTPPSLASMQSIPQLLASVQATGTVIRPSIIIQDIEAASTVFDRAVYRIVQESLTNAIKHAPGAPVTVDVGVSADRGARIVIANPAPQSGRPGERRDPRAEEVPPRPSTLPFAHDDVLSAVGRHGLSSTGSGAGLEGIRERAAMLDGTAEIGVRDGQFVVDVSLPPFHRRG
ncbi:MULTISPECIES: sensor histidine kinase [unclassified Brevibacterium]|uniref:sensor histidine kinase n=1 Tax=unclassified Brevibacterium TaxID=2614124 RepID=UPI00201105DA|nr:histidine kinase [Brevibacterium sp. W7.2]